MTQTGESSEETIHALQQRVQLLEDGMRQAAQVRQLWGKAVRELKATKAELKKSLSELTLAHQELGEKNESLELLYEQLQQEMELRQRMESELRLAQKLEAVGQLAAGIAHEINTPIQYIADNTRYLEESFDSYRRLVDALLAAGVSESAHCESHAAALATIESEFLTQVADDIPDAIADTLDGIAHVTNIVRSMKEFSHQGNGEKTPVDINHALEVTATVAHGELKHHTTIEWHLAEQLPEVYGIGSELNQVFLNLLVNAAQAIDESGGTARGGGMGCITITTYAAGDGVTIEITDDGIGIPDDIKDQVFDPFFTTKDVGVGTGQGLSIARSIVVDHHNGTIDVDSEPGKGTTFSIWLPAGV